MSDGIRDAEGKRYVEIGYLKMANATAKRRRERIRALEAERDAVLKCAAEIGYTSHSQDALLQVAQAIICDVDNFRKLLTIEQAAKQAAEQERDEAWTCPVCLEKCRHDTCASCTAKQAQSVIDSLRAQLAEADDLVRKLAAELAEKRKDTELFDWLQEEIVDTIYLDDGRIIDVRGGDVRAAIRALKEPK